MIDDVDAAHLSATEATVLRRDTIGIVFQQDNLLPSLTAVEQLAVMNELGARHGRRQRAAVTTHARELLVDEPTSAPDQERGASIIDLILHLTNERNTSTLLVTHDLVHLPRMHAVVNMVDGGLSTVRSEVLVTAG
ncbi:hypothetical protein GCM10009655_07240 [Rhodoglobus aureus]|uniref:Uncharacterized protein n=1 Tax=Rhodoglobus aureus TaxID=191497 RepID=A0ABP4G5H9_9MICO